MRSLIVALLFVLLTTAASRAEEAPQMPAPQKEHQWLQQLVGDWEADVEIHAEPGKPPMKTKSTETVRSIGGFWVVGEGTSSMGEGEPFRSILTIGYDPVKGKYVGSWVDSMTSFLWTYEGTVSADGKTLMLETTGPCPFKAGKLCKFRETTELTSPDERLFTSMVQDDDGKWVTVVVARSKRVKK